MIPSIQNYPLFEANQILTNEQLNQLFGYNDEQNRLTRTHLVGVGIVCGLDVITASDTKSITITRGCGVTSEGYLIIQDTDLVYTASRNYVLPQELAYSVLQTGFPLWELLPQIPPANTDTTVKAIDNAGNFLTDKVVMLFVELSKTGNKNCLPNSCDDKGSTITITIKPLLISKTNADKIKKVIPNYPAAVSLPDIRLPRFNVSKTVLTTTADVIKAYKTVLTKSFIDKAISNLKTLVDTYAFLNINATQLKSVLQSNTIFSYDTDGSIKLGYEYYYQYYYDFVSDLIDTYNEIKDKAGPVLAACCPDPSWFPRHLFLKEAINPPTPSNYRHYFIPSPVTAKQGQMTEEIVHLFNRLYLMLLSFPRIAAPTFITGGGVNNSDLRVTPSYLGTHLSGKAIPHYYGEETQSNGKKLFEYWNYKLTKAGKANQNLSYRAVEYPATEDFVKFPLKYDLEPYNFFNIEGHVGKNYKSVLTYLTSVKNSNRLPFDIVAIKTGNKADTLSGADFEAHFTDLENAFVLLQANIVCKGGNNSIVLAFKAMTKISQLDDLIPPANTTIITQLKSITSANIQCEVSELEKLLDTYNKRAKAIQEQYLLSNYGEQNVGLQHKGGVPAGGTFVILYHGDVVAPPVIGLLPEFIYVQEFSEAKAYKLDASTARKYNIDDSNSAIINKLLGSLNPDDPKSIDIIHDAFKPLTVSTKKRKLVGGMKGIYTGGIFTGGISTGIPVSVTEGTVFADFYLPYQCCGSGNPIQYIVQENATPLALSISKQECVDGSNEVTLSVSGGQPPYKNDGNEVGASFKKTFSSGTGGNITVTDSKNATVTVTVAENNCAPVCDKPCKGIYNACRYLVWMQYPPYDSVVYSAKETLIEIAYLTITDPNGTIVFDQQFVLPIRKLLESVGEVNVNTYHGFMKDTTRIIEMSVSAALDDLFNISYEFDQQNPEISGNFMIENYACYQFEMRIRMTVENNIYDYKYTNSGMNAVLEDAQGRHFEARMPKFGCTITDRCLDKRLLSECQNLLTIKQETASLFFITGEFKDIYWIAEGGSPAFFTGPQINLVRPYPVKLRVLAIDKKGCWSYAELAIKRADA